MRLLLIFCILFVSCKKDVKVTKPEKVMSHEKMTEVLIDMHLVDGYVNIGSTPQDTARFLLTKQYLKVFQKHGIDQNTFNESYKWYENHSDEYDLIYQEIVKQLEERQSKFKEK